MLVQDLLHDAVAQLPQKVALVCDGQRLTYSQIEAMGNRLANAMRECGLRRGDRAVVYLQNSVEAVIGIFAILKAGGVCVPVNHTTKRDKLAYILSNCGAATLLIDVARSPILATLTDMVPSLKFGITCGSGAASDFTSQTPCLAFDSLQATYPADRPPQQNIDLDLACLIYTSGSTGEPKGVMSDHSNVIFAVDSIVQYLQNKTDDIVISALPLSFDYGLYQLFMVFKFGGTLVLEHSFAFPAVILKRMQDERVTGFPGVPTAFSLMLQMDLSSFNLSSLRYLTNTAAALPPTQVLELRRTFPWARLYSMYGLTETKRTLYMPPEDLDRRPESVGIAIPGTEVWIEDQDGHRLGPGVVGELVVRGRHVMRGYWGDPIATAERFPPGPLPGERVCHTGDLFRMDEDGYFYFVGRNDDIIKSRGEKIAPKEVENVLYSLEGVVEAAVVGVPDPILGHAIKAFVVCRNAQLSQGDVLGHCRAHLEDFMVPRYVEFCDSLPKTASGKIKRSDLK